MKKGDYVKIVFPNDLSYSERGHFTENITGKRFWDSDELFKVQWSNETDTKLYGLKLVISNVHLEIATSLYNDVVGRKLSINDKVSYIESRNRRLNVGFIKSLGPKAANIVDKVGDEYGIIRNYNMISKI